MKAPSLDWIRGWGAQYARDLDEALFDPWSGRTRLPREGWISLAHWKFNRDSRRRNAALAGIQRQTDATLEELSASAVRFEGDWYPLRIVSLIKGIGPAMGSAVLACTDPKRFSVFDVNALRAARAFDQSIPDAPNNVGTYGPYMNWVREASRVCDSIRELDRALFLAGRHMIQKGLVTPPPTPDA